MRRLHDVGGGGGAVEREAARQNDVRFGLHDTLRVENLAQRDAKNERSLAGENDKRVRCLGNARSVPPQAATESLWSSSYRCPARAADPQRAVSQQAKRLGLRFEALANDAD
jgi:hypothetical protein